MAVEPTSDATFVAGSGSQLGANQPTALAAESGIAGESATDVLPEEARVQNVSSKSWEGKVLDKYLIESWLGGGGMGQVYLARHRWLEVPFAIKIMNPLHTEDPEIVDRFRREAKISASLSHPNIVKATDGGAIGSNLYLVTEYLDGMDLKQVVKQFGPIPQAQACWLVAQTAQALNYAHQQGTIHRDIKPSNIMLLDDGSIKLLDLGLARCANSQTNMTATGQFMGTVDFVSPEQAADTKHIDHRADIYSLGCTLYYLLTGRAPFEGDDYDTIVSKILAHTEEAPLPANTIASVGSPVMRILDKMMAKHPDDRYDNCGLVAQALEGFAQPYEVNPKQSKSAASTNHLLKAKPSEAETVLTKVRAGGLTASWLVFRTLLSIIGVIEKVQVGSSRLGKERYEWRVSAKGVATVTVIGFFILFVFFSGFIEIVEVR